MYSVASRLPLTTWNAAHRLLCPWLIRILEWVAILLQGIFPTHGLNPYLLCLKKYWYVETYIWICNFNAPPTIPPLRTEDFCWFCPFTTCPFSTSMPLLQGLYRLLLFPFSQMRKQTQRLSILPKITCQWVTKLEFESRQLGSRIHALGCFTDL